MRLVWRDMARHDRLRIMGHISQANPKAAISLDESFAEKAKRAAQAPSIYKPGRYQGTRRGNRSDPACKAAMALIRKNRPEGRFFFRR